MGVFYIVTTFNILSPWQMPEINNIHRSDDIYTTRGYAVSSVMTIAQKFFSVILPDHYI